MKQDWPLTGLLKSSGGVCMEINMLFCVCIYLRLFKIQNIPGNILKWKSTGVGM